MQIPPLEKSSAVVPKWWRGSSGEGDLGGFAGGETLGYSWGRREKEGGGVMVRKEEENSSVESRDKEEE